MSRKWNIHGCLESFVLTHSTDIKNQTKGAAVYTNILFMVSKYHNAVLSTHGLDDIFDAMLPNVVLTAEFGTQTT
jgi:hypothetical protein